MIGNQIGGRPDGSGRSDIAVEKDRLYAAVNRVRHFRTGLLAGVGGQEGIGTNSFGQNRAHGLLLRGTTYCVLRNTVAHNGSDGIAVDVAHAKPTLAIAQNAITGNARMGIIWPAPAA